MISSSVMNSGIIYGRIVSVVCLIDILDICVSMNSIIFIGGVRSLIIRFSVMMMFICIGLMLYFVVIGIRIGIRIEMVVMVFRNVLMISRMMLMMIRKVY